MSSRRPIHHRKQRPPEPWRGEKRAVWSAGSPAPVPPPAPPYRADAIPSDTWKSLPPVRDDCIAIGPCAQCGRLACGDPLTDTGPCERDGLAFCSTMCSMLHRRVHEMRESAEKCAETVVEPATEILLRCALLVHGEDVEHHAEGFRWKTGGPVRG